MKLTVGCPCLLGALLAFGADLAAAPVGVFDNAQDVGVPPVAGSTTLAGTTYTLRATGDDVWDNGDQCHFAYKQVRGDFSLTVRVTRRDRTPAGSGQWGRHGLMARWTAAADSKYSLVGTVLPTEDAPGAWHPPLYQFRMFHGQAATTRAAYWADEGLFPDERRLPTWMRLVRIGPAIHGYLAEDANNDNQPDRWVLVGSDSSPYTPEDLLVGVFCHSQAGANLATVAFDNVSFVVNDQKPLVECAPGQVFAEVNFDTDDLRVPPGRTGSVAAFNKAGPLAPYTHNGKLILLTGFNLESANMLWYLLGGSEQLTEQGFEAEFDAFMEEHPFDDYLPADGMTFSVVQASPAVFANGIPANFGGDGGASLGYGNGALRDLVEQCPSFAVELDNWVNSQDGGQPGNEPGDSGSPANPRRYHVGLDVNGEVSSIQTNADYGVPTQLLPDIFSAAGVRVRMRYAPDGQIDVWVRSNVAPGTQYRVISSRIPPLSGPVMFGFTASTGGAAGHHFVDNLKVTLLECTAQPPESLTPKVIDLGNVTGGGDGLFTSPAPYVGIDPRTGRFATTYFDGLVSEFDAGFSDNKNPSPADGPYVDSVFFNTNYLSGEFHIPQDITQSGVKYRFPENDITRGLGYNHILADRIGGISAPGIRVGPHTGFTTAVGMHASVGVTYDLDALRGQHGWRNVQVFHTVAGLDDCAGGEVDMFILLASDAGVMVEKILHFVTGGHEVVTMPIPSTARYLTLAVGNDGDLNCDHGTFARPTITGGPTTRDNLLHLWHVQPSLFPPGGGQSIAISGEYLGVGAQFAYLVGGKPVTNLQLISETVVWGTLPSLPGGFHDLDVIQTTGNPAAGGTVRARLRNAIEVSSPPVVTSVEPNKVFADSPNLLTVHGRNFRRGATRFEVKGTGNDIHVIGPVELSDTRIVGTVPAQAAGAKDVVASDVRGSSVLTRGLTFVDPSTIQLTSVSPAKISTSGDTVVTFRGQNFAAGMTLPRLGGKDLTEVVFVSANQLRGKAPVLAAGRHSAQLVRPAGSVLASVPNAVEALPPVTITQVIPRDVYSDRSTRVLIRGTNFRRDAIGIRVGSQELADLFVEADGRSITGRVLPMPLDESLGPRDVVAIDILGEVRLPAGARYVGPPDPTAAPPGPMEVEGNLAEGEARFYWFNPVDYAQILIRDASSAPLATLPGDAEYFSLAAPGATKVRIQLLGVLANGNRSTISQGVATVHACDRPAPLTGNDSPGAGNLSLSGGSPNLPPAACGGAGGGGSVEEEELAAQGHGGGIDRDSKGFVTPAVEAALAALSPSKLTTGFTLTREADKLEISCYYQKLATDLGLALRGRLERVSDGPSFEDEFTFPDVTINAGEKSWYGVTYFRAQSDVGGAVVPERCPGNPKIPAGDYRLDIFAVGGDHNFPYYLFGDDGRSQEILIPGVPCPPYPRVRVTDITGFVSLPNFTQAFEVFDVRKVANGIRARITAHGYWLDERSVAHSLDPADRTYSDHNFKFNWAIFSTARPKPEQSDEHTIDIFLPDYGCYKVELYVTDQACGLSKMHPAEIAVLPPNPPCGNSAFNFSHLTPEPGTIWALAGLSPPPGNGQFEGTRPLDFRVLVTPCPCTVRGTLPCQGALIDGPNKDIEIRLAVRQPGADVGIAALQLEDLCPNQVTGAKYFQAYLDDLGAIPLIPGNDGHTFSDVYLQGRSTRAGEGWRDIAPPLKMANAPPSLANTNWQGRFVARDQSYHFVTQSSEGTAQELPLPASKPLSLPLPGASINVPSYGNELNTGLAAAFMTSQGKWMAENAVGTLGGQVMGSRMDGEPSIVSPKSRGGGGGEGGGGIVSLPSYEWCDSRTLFHNQLNQTLFQSLLFSGFVGPVPVTIWASVQLGIEVTIKSAMKFRATPFQALLSGGNFVQSDFLLTTDVAISIPCQIRADVLFGIASIAARLIPEAKGNLQVHLGTRDAEWRAGTEFSIALSLYFQLKACLIGICATFEEDIFRDESLVSKSIREPTSYRLPTSQELQDCKQGAGGGEDEGSSEFESTAGLATDGGGGDFEVNVLQIVSAPVSEATRDGQTVLDVWFKEDGKPLVQVNGSPDGILVPAYYNVTGSFNDPSAGFIRNDLALIAWTSDRYAADSGINPSNFGNLSTPDRNKVESQREVVVSLVRRVPRPGWDIELPFSISDLADQSPSPVPLANRRADGRPAVATDPLHQEALVAWVRYETPDVFAQDPGETTSYYRGKDVGGKPGFELVPNVPRVRAQLDRTAIYVRRLDFKPGATRLGAIQRISIPQSGAGTSTDINIEPAIAISPTGDSAYCVWVHDPTHEDLIGSNRGRFLVYSRYTRSTGVWTTPRAVIPNPDDFPGILHPDVSLSDDDSGMVVFTALDKSDCRGTPGQCELETGLAGSGRYVYTCRLSNGNFAPPVQIHGKCGERVVGVWTKLLDVAEKVSYDPASRYFIINPAQLLLLQGLGPAGTRAGAGNVVAAAFAEGMSQPGEVLTLTDDSNGHTNVTGSFSGGKLHTLNLNLGPATFRPGAGGGGGLPEPAGYEVIETPLHPDLAIVDCMLSDQFAGPGVLVTARVVVDNLGLAGSAQDQNGRSGVGVRAVFVRADGAEEIVAAGAVGVTAPGGRTVVDLDIEMPHDPVRLRVELGPNPIDRDYSNNSRECFFGAPSPRDVLCQPTQLADRTASDAALITWTNPVSYDEILICRDGALLASLPGSATSFVDPGSMPLERSYMVRGRVGASKSKRIATPCEIVTPPEPEFLRGDADASGEIDISDPISTLGFLFLGARAPSCFKAADADDSGELDITDAIKTLAYLFSGGVKPPQPHPSCGRDPTVDELSCVEYEACP